MIREDFGSGWSCYGEPWELSDRVLLVMQVLVFFKNHWPK